MAKLKGLKKIDKIINEFTKQFSVTANLGSEFQAFCEKRVINYSLITTEEEQNFFINDAIKKYPNINADIFIWCLLHEIFHVVTDYMWTEEELEYFKEQKEKLAYLEDDQQRNDWYHCIPNEFIATRSAANYMMSHPKKIAKFWGKLQKALMNLYTKNGLI
jgi:hypothetical protein